MRWAAGAATPVFLRVGRFKVPAVTGDRPFTFGVASRLRDGTDVTVVATGTMVSRALEAAEEAADQGVSVRVLNMSTIAPLDERGRPRGDARDPRRSSPPRRPPRPAAWAPRSPPWSSPSAAPVPMRMLGVHREFAPTGSTAFLLEHFGLTAADIRSAAVGLARADA